VDGQRRVLGRFAFRLLPEVISGQYIAWGVREGLDANHYNNHNYDMDSDLQNLLSFERPPIIETALGVQFAPIARFSAGHYGWFWKQYLDASWTKSQDGPRLINQFEKFGEQAAWRVPSPPVVFQGPAQPDRIMFVNDGDDRVIQIQDDRFYYNWRKRQGDYPSFAETYPEFRRYLQTFEDFLQESGLEATLQNQWELTYFNSIPRGELWSSPSDWPAMLPGLFGRIDAQTDTLVLESFSGMWKCEIPPRRGRLYISAQHTKSENDQEVLQVHLTARGPIIAGDDEWDLASGMGIGHAALVRTFRSIASSAALSHWRAR
jgi:uncharacterized protein (TIGR04255 family)